MFDCILYAISMYVARDRIIGSTTSFSSSIGLFPEKEKALLPLLSSEASIAFEQYQTAVQCRNSAVLEQAYASGYRTAVQMFAAGLGPQPPIPEHEEDSNG